MPVVKLYLPTDAQDYDTALEHVQKWFCEDFGGFTMYEGTGGWRDGGDIITEPVTVIETVANERPSDMHAAATAVAEGVKNMTDENAVMVAVDGEKIMVDGE